MTMICDWSNHNLNRDVEKIQTKHPILVDNGCHNPNEISLVHEEISQNFCTSNFRITNMPLINDLIGSFHYVLSPWFNS